MLTIKNSSKDTVIAFNNSGVPVGKRSQADLIDLAIIGHESGHKAILEVFEGPLPSLQDLKAWKMGNVEKKLNAGNQSSTDGATTNTGQKKDNKEK